MPCARQRLDLQHGPRGGTRKWYSMLRILDRYLLKELAFGSLGSAALLLVVTVGGTLSDVLSKVAAGRYPASVMFPVLGLRVLDALSALLPVALFLGVLLGLARLYRDSEMHVLSSSRMGPQGLLRPTLLLAIPAALLVGVISLWLGPWSAAYAQTMVDSANRSVVAAGLEAGRFTELPGGNGVIYTQTLSPDGQHLSQVFIASEREQPGQPPQVDLVTAARGDMFVDPGSGDRFLDLRQGHRYSGRLGQSDWRLLDYRRNDVSLARVGGAAAAGTDTPHQQTTWTLLHEPAPADRAELAWRIAAPLSTLVLALLALPLARQRPREPFYGRLLIAILAYLVFANVLGIGRAQIMAGKRSGVWLMAIELLLVTVLALYGFARQHSARRVRGAHP